MDNKDDGGTATGGAPVDAVVSRLSFFTAKKDDMTEFGWVDPEGCHWDGPIDYLQGYLLGFCCCGCPEENLAFVHDGLAHINALTEESSVGRCKEWDEFYAKWRANGRAIFGNEQARYFFFYWADKEGLTEHGGSVPGWLTDKGKTLLADLRLIKEAGMLDD